MKNLSEGFPEKVARISTEYEECNTEEKRKYLLRNIHSFAYLVSLIKYNKGSFGTGYPFYVLDEYLDGKLPIIREQIRYNNELLQNAEKEENKEWKCKECLQENADKMPDLKTICGSCREISDTIKPRKLMNRLPDIDMWMVCEDGHVKESQEQLSKLLKKANIKTSDVDPVETIGEVEEIVESLKNGEMPAQNKFLPIDTHIIEVSELKELIDSVPEVLRKSKEEDKIPYLPIKPYSYRKKWEKDNKGYNFIYDFLATFKAFNLVPELQNSLNETRRRVANEFSLDELYAFLLDAATDASKRRCKTIEIPVNFRKKILNWRKIPKQINNQSNVRREHEEER